MSPAGPQGQPGGHDEVAVPSVPSVPVVPPGLYADPWAPGSLREWDGRAWTAVVHPRPPLSGAQRLRVPGRVLGPRSVGVFAVTGALAVIVLLLSVGPAAFVVATGAALLLLPAYAWLALSLDRFHPEPRAALLWTFLAGATAVVLWALLLNGIGEVLLASALGQPTADAVTLAVVAPVVEEVGKAAVLVLLYRRFRHQISGPLDGVVYATMVGLGFATVENVLYYGTSIADGSLPVVFVLRGLLSPFAHPVFTACTGIGLGLLAAGRTRLGRGAPLLGLLLSIVLHALWNGSTLLGALGVLAMFFLLMVPVFLGLVALCRREARREKAMLRHYLQPEVDAGLLTASDLQVFRDVTARRRLVRAARAVHPRAGVAAHELAADLLELANTRDRVANGAFSERYGAPAAVLGELAERVSRARWALPPAPAQAPWTGLSGALGLPLPRPGQPLR